MKQNILYLVACSPSCFHPVHHNATSSEPRRQTCPLNLKATRSRTDNPSLQNIHASGKNISPALSWNDPPAGTQSFALIVDDPDAPMGTWVHWVLFNIPADKRSLQEDLPVTGKNVDPNAIYVGKNSSGNIGYDGPCPPSGTHRYYFKLYALDTPISLLPGATKDELLKEMKGHILAQGELMGTFSK